jgi:hypothetical protein
MRAVLGLLCFLSVTCNATSDADPTRSAKLAAAEALLSEIAARAPRPSNDEAEGLPDGLARAVEAWSSGRGEE